MHRKSFCADDGMSIVEKYSNMVYRLAYSLLKTRCDADDIHQEVFIKYLDKRPRFENEEHAKAWFIRVTVNMCKNFWKSAWRQRVTGLEEIARMLGLKSSNVRTQLTRARKKLKELLEEDV